MAGSSFRLLHPQPALVILVVAAGLTLSTLPALPASAFGSSRIAGPSRNADHYGCTIANDLERHLPEVGSSPATQMTLRRSMDGIDWTPEPADLLADSPDEGVGFVAASTPEGYRLRFDGLYDFDVSHAPHCTRKLAHSCWMTGLGRLTSR